MKSIRNLLAPAALLAALALPAASLAQSAPGAPNGQTARGGHQHGGMMMRELAKLNLSADQQSKITALRSQFRAAHAKGSPRDPQAMKAYHAQMMAILTPQQQSQFKADVAAFHKDRGENGAAEGANGHTGMMNRYTALNLSAQQQSQIDALTTEFRQAHPAGSPRDPQAMQALRKQIDAILTPAQLQQLQQMHKNKPNESNESGGSNR